MCVAARSRSSGRMGKRGRRQIAGAALKMARTAAAQTDDELRDIAQLVYNIGRELKSNGEADPLPLAILAPLMAAAEAVAPGVLRLAKLPVTEEMAREVAAYLVAGFREMAVMLDPEHFEQWRQMMDAAERSGQEAG
jgi:hypothetical protein